MALTPGQLAAALGQLAVSVSSVHVRQRVARVGDYPDGGRPTSTVCLSGEGHSGFGENVAFTRIEHERFGSHADYLLVATDGRIRGRVDQLLRPDMNIPPYERAALQAALIDLAMRQAGLSLADVMGTTAVAPLRFVVSFAACSDPSRRVRRLRDQGYAGDFKIDVDPSWDPSTRKALARQSGIAILDFKGRGDAPFADQLATLFPNALLEDPPADTKPERIARDATLLDANDVAKALSRKEAVNLKAPRMGGPLELLRGLDLAARAGAVAYLGGMFEIGAGRTQARQLAALFCAHAPNDLALLTAVVASAPSLAPIRLDTPGFGADA